MTRLRPALAMLPFVAAVALSSFPAAAADYDVKMSNLGPNGLMDFVPALLRIKPGDRVRFVPADKGHNVSLVSGMAPEGAQGFAGGLNETLTVQFTKEGVYGYRCNPHYAMGMVGLIVVGKPVNEAAATAVTHPGPAKARFAKLFQQLDAGF